MCCQKSDFFDFHGLILVLPQLRSVTSMELGCDARGYSRAGNDTMVWYCVVLAGRLSPELEKMREVSSFSLLLCVVVALVGNC